MRLSFALGFLVLFGCGNGSEGGAPADAAAGAADADPCGPIFPSMGTPCTVDQQRCEIAGDAGARCGITAVCGRIADGEGLRWFVDDRTSLCAPSAEMCPASFAAVAEGAACPAGSTVNAPCAYPEGRCACVDCDPGDAGPVDAGAGVPTSAMWHCQAWAPTTPGCPDVRPVVGTLCSPAALDCDYRDDCRATGSGGDFECDGRWRPTESTFSKPCTKTACPPGR
jgi:hypothetical protein